MSTQRGSGPKRIRPQKHKNKFAFKNDLHDKTPQMKKINSLNVCEVCARCRAQIEWKIKYKKYKPLSQAKTCIRCSQRTVKKAYHVMCKECAKEERVCAKCLKSAEIVEIEPAEPTPDEQQQIKVEMERMIKTFPERKRRTFLRYMKRGKKPTEIGNDDPADGDEHPTDTEREIVVRPNIPYTRDELLQKIENLKMTDPNEDLSSDSDIETNSDDYDSEDDFNEVDSDQCNTAKE